MAPSQKMLEILLKLRGETRGREFSRARKLKMVSEKKTDSIKRVLFASPVFLRKYKKDISTARHLISLNLKKLMAGQEVNEKGFSMRSTSTGKTHFGNNNDLTLCVSFKGRSFFVKIGADAGESHARAYHSATDFFKSIGNKMGGFRVESVPYHMFYLKTNSKKPLNARGFAVSDFFPKEKVTLVSDIESTLGKANFKETKLGAVLDKLQSDLSKRGVLDAGTHNCFFDEAKNTIYFFDLWALK